MLMTDFSSKDIKHTAQLSHLQLTPNELQKFEKQLGDVLEHVEKLSEVDTSDTKPVTNTANLSNQTRQDKLDLFATLNQKKALQESKNTYNNYFKVSALLDKRRK